MPSSIFRKPLKASSLPFRRIRVSSFPVSADCQLLPTSSSGVGTGIQAFRRTAPANTTNFNGFWRSSWSPSLQNQARDPQVAPGALEHWLTLCCDPQTDPPASHSPLYASLCHMEQEGTGKKTIPPQRWIKYWYSIMFCYILFYCRNKFTLFILHSLARCLTMWAVWDWHHAQQCPVPQLRDH